MASAAYHLLVLQGDCEGWISLHATATVVEVLAYRVSALGGALSGHGWVVGLLVVVIDCHDMPLLHHVVVGFLFEVFGLIIIRFQLSRNIVAISVYLLRESRHFGKLLMDRLPSCIVALVA